ncbi:hypothetical protein [Brevibacillus laterosporus]|uniref:hypothetical protein n=2 Tax=Brevibacillus TaxID=55080 RepID=UPI0018CD0121|nr:hypothetical protein [Brevibacillus laterosporus]MBG9787880.1 hypothetical protein [Brevibacillus laterosporus]
MNNFIKISIILGLFTLSIVLGASSLYVKQAMGKHYRETPEFKKNQNIYVTYYEQRGDHLFGNITNKYGNNKNFIWSKFYLGNPNKPKDRFGFSTSYNKKTLRLEGFDEVDDDYKYDALTMEYKIESDALDSNVRHVMAYKDITRDEVGYLGIQYKIKEKDTLNYNHVIDQAFATAGTVTNWQFGYFSDFTIVEPIKVYPKK